MRHTLSTLFLACVFVGGIHAADEAPAGNPGDDYKLKLSEWSYGRERKTITGSNRVSATITVKNSSAETINDIKLTLNYFSGLGEKVTDKSIIATPGSIKAGESKKVALVAEFIPVFHAYTITVEHSGSKKEEWRANSDIANPEPAIAAPLKGTASVAILGQEAGTDRSGRFSGIVRVKNEGTVEAKGVKITVNFFDAKRKVLGTWSGPLGKGALAGGAEEKVPFTAANAPSKYNGYEIKIGCDDTPGEAALSGGEFSSAKDVEFAQFQFKRSDPKAKEMKVTAKVRNGFDVPVDLVKLNLAFFSLSGPRKKELKQFTYEVPGQLKAGEIKQLEFTISELPAYETYEQVVGYNKLDGGGAPAAPAGTAAPTEKPAFKKTSGVEVIFTTAMANEDKSVSLLGAMRNGKDSAVKDVIVTLVFEMQDGSKQSVDKTLPDVAQPGEERNFVVKAPGVAGYKNYTYSFKFSETGAAASK